MEFLTHTNIDFMKYRKVFVWVSVTLLVIATLELFFLTGLNLGIDFAGGTQLTVKTREAVAIDEVRRILEQAGMREAQIQRFGSDDSNEILIKAPVVGGSEEGSGQAVIDALEGALNTDAGRFDLNQGGTDSLAIALAAADPLSYGGTVTAADYRELAAAIVERREENGVFTTWEEVASVEGVTPAVLSELQSSMQLGAFHVLQAENVGPQIGSELRQKGVLAVVMSLLGMLAYIWYRFELRFGIGAMVATFHDLLITLGLYALVGYEFNLPTIAAFLTLVGYSVNDTVVIFDRVRENMRRRRRLDLVTVINDSLNQTLVRTILTSGTTLIAVASLFFFGGEVLRGFSFVLLVGIVVGTYSSVYVASAFTVLWEERFGSDRRAPGEGTAEAKAA